MAGELRFNATLQVVNGSINAKFGGDVRSNQTTAGAVSKTQTVPTSDTVLSLTGVTAPRTIVIKNMDDTNYIDIGPTVAGAIAPMIRLQPGEESGLMLYPTVILRGIAHTGAVQVAYMLAET